MNQTITIRTARPCPNHTHSRSTRDYLTGKLVHEHCENCSGAGVIYGTRQVALGTSDARTDKAVAAARAIGMLKAFVESGRMNPDVHDDMREIIAEYDYARERLEAQSDEVTL